MAIKNQVKFKKTISSSTYLLTKKRLKNMDFSFEYTNFYSYPSSSKLFG